MCVVSLNVDGGFDDVWGPVDPVSVGNPDHVACVVCPEGFTFAVPCVVSGVFVFVDDACGGTAVWEVGEVVSV